MPLQQIIAWIMQTLPFSQRHRKAAAFQHDPRAQPFPARPGSWIAHIPAFSRVIKATPRTPAFFVRACGPKPEKVAVAARQREAGHDFLKPMRSADNIVTNPPYNCAEGFVASGIKHARHKFALLLRLAFLEGANRANTIFANSPPARVWVFSERITFYPSGVEPKGTGTTAYAWFVWDKDAPRTTELKWFKPGYRARYS